MTPPKWTGLKKNHSAMWLGEWIGFTPPLGTIRILDSKGQWKWGHSDDEDWMVCLLSNEFLKPCWQKLEMNAVQNVERMIEYDRRMNNETIFLGYVKDTE